MYQALYRKWRPKSFDDVVSQPQITATLKNQIASGRTAHAYLFTGSRGTGKTTCARIFAKAINCPNSHDGEPCLECDICRAAENGSLADIIEIDAASNSRVDDIRELREGVIYTPELCKYKIYIIDEVHMLSPGAFNALLKTMEEPPPHVKFILATTEIHKVPETIVSRCQHFDFNRTPNYETRMAILKKRAELDNIMVDDESLNYIATNIKSSIRELEGALKQIYNFSRLRKKTINFDLTKEALENIISPEEKRPVTCELIIDTVAEHYNISPDDIKSTKRNKEIAYPRQICMYLCRKMPLLRTGRL